MKQAGSPVGDHAGAGGDQKMSWKLLTLCGSRVQAGVCVAGARDGPLGVAEVPVPRGDTGHAFACRSAAVMIVPFESTFDSIILSYLSPC